MPDELKERLSELEAKVHDLTGLTERLAQGTVTIAVTLQEYLDKQIDERDSRTRLRDVIDALEQR